ncbi:MAG: hypothetical protein JSV44_08310, partial [Candidatus Zixiibacteriota bacterium]
GDLTAAAAFFADYIAAFPFDTLRADAMAVGYGQGSPGVVHLSESTFDRSRKGEDDKFRAHEVAHQWWGHLVGPATYRDIWLSEGLAEYSAALYLLLGKNDDKAFQHVLREWRKKIVQRGMMGGRKSVGFRAGSIWLGYRLKSELSPGDYEAIIYYKAAYMLHMLRYELRQQAGGNDSFRQLLSEFAHKYANRLVTTGDFIATAGQFLHERTDQFFKQWLYDWRVPKIKKRWRRSDNGYIDVLIRVEGVGDDFFTPYPVEIIGDDDAVIAREVYMIKNGENHFKFDAIINGTRIAKVNFNPRLDILEQ